MKYTIEFEIPDNETMLEEMKTRRVQWRIDGYSGSARAKPKEEVVRCKNCKHKLECDYWIENGDDWFCADGERKDQERSITKE